MVSYRQSMDQRGTHNCGFALGSWAIAWASLYGRRNPKNALPGWVCSLWMVSNSQLEARLVGTRLTSGPGRREYHIRWTARERRGDDARVLELARS